MAEIAIVAARKSKLAQLANEGNKNAQAALELAKTPNKFLSTAQIGITLIGILAGAFGGTTIADSLSVQLDTIPFLDPYSDAIALGIVVAVITYLSLIIGELVPKRLALRSPEKIASYVARPMNVLSSLAAPLVALLSISTDWVLNILRIKPKEQSPVSAEEILTIIREGARVGIFEMVEKDIFERMFRLGDHKVNAIMTPRKEVVWLDADSSFKTIQNKIAKHAHSYFPVCRDSLDKVLGVVRTEDLLIDYLADEKIDLEKSLHKPPFIPGSMNALKVLEHFKKTGIHTALVIDEHGFVLGLVSLADILEAIVGELPSVNELEEAVTLK